MAPVPQEPVSLLLLPALQLPSTPASLKSSYRSTLEALLPKLIQPNSQTISRLDIAIVLSPSYPVTQSISRTAIFPLLQTLLAQTYSLVCSVGALTKVDLDFPGGLDVRIFALEPRNEALSSSIIGKQTLSGPLVDIQTFVSASRPYNAIYSVEGETAEAHLKSVITAWQSRQGAVAPPLQRLPSGPAIAHPGGSASPYADDGPVEVHKSVAVGGTFDHLHIGHKLLLTATVLLAEPSSPASSQDKKPRHITVGITGDDLLVNKKYGSVVESWSTRQERTAEFVESILVFHTDSNSIKKTEYINEPGPNGKVVRVTYGDDISINYTEIIDPFGPTITDESITALVISGETRAGGKAVNDKRKEKGWKELEVFEVDVLDAGAGLDDSEIGDKQEKQNFESKISSTEIRRRLHEAQTSASG
ncbi:elongator complex protein 2 [Exophiala viscosa]|uniref:Elongator complex protein 2 n=1 Tax=Exophiala viscosa TaxID=2486360 RepID=A0AAN6DWF0_9EURO|nr:elongator complex protein 2 [Exophiala viscosa]KAI1622521.1 elongator complex protein 2 [Exophiala viscosa]